MRFHGTEYPILISVKYKYIKPDRVRPDTNAILIGYI
jgi:hypothetical protein